MSQQPPRPWFRLASMVRPSLQPTTRPPPPPPPPVQQQTFRPPVALPTPAQPGAAITIPPRASAPPSPILPTTVQPGAATTIPRRASAPPSPIRPTTVQPAAATTIPPRSSAPPSPIRPTPEQPAATIPPRTSAPASPTPVASPPPPRAAASPSPPTPQPTAPPSPAKIPTPSIPRTTAPPSPAKTPPSTQTWIETQLQKSPAKNGGISQPAYSITKSTTTSPAQSPPPPPPPISSNSKPSSPITKTNSYPWQKSSPKTAAIPSFPAPSPKTKSFSAPPPSPLPTSTPFQTVPSSPDPNATPIATRAMSPRIDKPWVETPPQSAKEKLLSHPPSPLSLPPAQIMEPIPAEIEQKTVLFQETDHDKSKTNSHKPSSSNGAIQRFQDGKREIKKDKGVNSHSQIKKYNSDSEESGFRVVTLAGENKGAIMELMSPFRKNKNYGSENGGIKLKNNSGDEGSSWSMKLDGKNKATAMETPPMDAFINCNVQGVNNSILYNCSSTHHDPGVHLSVSRKLKPGRYMKDN